MENRREKVSPWLAKQLSVSLAIEFEKVFFVKNLPRYADRDFHALIAIIGSGKKNKQTKQTK